VFYYGDTWRLQEAKYAWLDSVSADLSNIPFEQVGGTGLDAFVPNLGLRFHSWPHLKDDIFVYSISGVQTKRDDLVVAPTSQKLQEQILQFLNASSAKQHELFHETRDKAYAPASQTPYDHSHILRYSYRRLDIQYLYNHSRFLDYDRRNSLQKVWRKRNIAFSSSRSEHGHGPSIYLFNYLPDLNSYNGRSSYVMPLWDNRREGLEQASLLERQHNFNPRLLSRLGEIWGWEPTPENLFAYCYGVLSTPSYALEFSRELAQSFPRVPFPPTWEIFQEGMRIGHELVQLHSFEQTYPADGSLQLSGTSHHIEYAEYSPNDEILYIAPDAQLSPVSCIAWAYSVSGYQVLRQWLLRRRGLPLVLSLRRELLDILWVIERTVDLSDTLDDFFTRLLEGSTLTRNTLELSSTR
jgi:predicted helicase